MTDKIEGGGIPPDLRATYKQDFARGFDLFQKSLTEYKNADEINKKAKFKDVMDKTLQVMNEVARAALSDKGQLQEKELEKDYQNLIANESEQNYNKLKEDINNLKNGLT